MIAIAPLLFLQALQTPVQTERPFELMLGDAAPAIVVTEWVQGQPVTKFVPGQIYVVEFWATWCGPCKEAIPHVNELSKRYAGKVQFIGVSVWEEISAEEPYWVPKFVKGMGEKMTYAVASDRVRADDPARMSEAWLKPAGQTGIPTAFIVNGEGRIAWVGHPMKMDEPLSAVVAGKWDLEGAIKKHALDMRAKGVSARLGKEISNAKKSKDFATALRIIDETLAKEPALEANFGVEKYFLLLEAQRPADAATYGQRLVSQVIGDNPMALNQLAWTIVDPKGKWKQGDYALAVLAAERAVKLQEEKDAATLDTLGLALFRAGQIDRAIQVQTKAVELAKGDAQYEAEFRDRLIEFKNAKKNL